MGDCSGIVPALLTSPREKAIENVMNGHMKQLSASYARFGISGFNSYLLLIKITQLTCNFFSVVLCKQQAHFRRGYLSHTHGLLINCSTKILIVHLFCHLSISCLRSLIVFFAIKTGPLNFGVILCGVDELPQFIRYRFSFSTSCLMLIIGDFQSL